MTDPSLLVDMLDALDLAPCTKLRSLTVKWDLENETDVLVACLSNIASCPTLRTFTLRIVPIGYDDELLESSPPKMAPVDARLAEIDWLTDIIIVLHPFRGAQFAEKFVSACFPNLSPTIVVP